MVVASLLKLTYNNLYLIAAPMVTRSPSKADILAALAFPANKIDTKTHPMFVSIPPETPYKSVIYNTYYRPILHEVL